MSPFRIKKVYGGESERADVGDRWTFVNVLPRSGLIHTVHHGKRTKEEAEQFVQTIKKNSDGEAPLFLSDGWQPYQDVLEAPTVMKNRSRIQDGDARRIRSGW